MLSRGSEWNRWDPHIHSPDTVLNDQFRGTDPWSRYLDALEAKTPRIRAIGVTDYYLTDNYERVLQFKETGRLPDVELIFPNIEMRLDAAARSGFINIHLLVSPEDRDHVRELGRILSRLTFSAFQDNFACTKDDLIRLGTRANPNIQDERAALRKGATQFKVNFNELREVFGQNAWAKRNVLVAVAGGSGDGTSGLRDGADATVRQEIEASPMSFLAAIERNASSGSGSVASPWRSFTRVTEASNLACMVLMPIRKTPLASRRRTGFLGSRVA